MKHLTYDGKTTIKQAPKTVEIILSNATDTAVKRVIVGSPARVKSPGYHMAMMKEADDCKFQPNDHFKTLAEFQHFVNACPTEILSVFISPITSSNIEEQLTDAVKLKTPTFGNDLIENIDGVSGNIGSYQYPFHNVLLGEAAEVEVTVYPQNSFKLTIQLGGYYTRRLVPTKM